MNLRQLRAAYHERLLREALGENSGVPNIADWHSPQSVAVAKVMLNRMGHQLRTESPADDIARACFVSSTQAFIQHALDMIVHLRPGPWVSCSGGASISFEGYEELTEVAQSLAECPDESLTPGAFVLRPDILIGRNPVLDSEINRYAEIITNHVATLTPFRVRNHPGQGPILMAGISCNWKVNSGNARSSAEPLNLIRNRKGNAPHIAIVTAEPLPSRIASIALGTGDIDCVYHIALYELADAVSQIDDETLTDMYNLLVDGKRLRDISDLPFDLAI